MHRASVLQNWGFRVVQMIKMRKQIVYDLTLQTRISTEIFFQFGGIFCFSFDIFQVISLAFSFFFVIREVHQPLKLLKFSSFKLLKS